MKFFAQTFLFNRLLRSHTTGTSSYPLAVVHGEAYEPYLALLVVEPVHDGDGVVSRPQLRLLQPSGLPADYCVLARLESKQR